MPLAVGDIAPDFKALDQSGKVHSLADYRGQWLLLYFYPKDDTPGCTTEACSFRDSYETLSHRLNLIGISTDTVNSHQKFSLKYHLPFTILADEDKCIVKAYLVYAPKKFMGKEYLGTHRVSYLINPQGKITHVYPKVNPKTHTQEILALINEL
jgi:peroxiredoxin Q/BCP